MFPIRDSTPRRSFPFINYLIIAINIYVFLLQLNAPDFERFVFQYGFIPSRFDLFDFSTYRYVLNSIFMHGGFFHILLNMWFLHIFGDNIEDRLGHIRYLVFYLLAGFVATMAQYIFITQATIPLIGASGAISGVAGAYFVLFRRSTVKTLVTLLFFWQVIELPVTIFLGYWFITQVFNGLGSLVAFDMNAGGVGWFAHIGGFVFGYWIAKNVGRERYAI